MICAFCQAFEDDAEVVHAHWEPTFMWRLREYEGPVCAACTLGHLVPRHFDGGCVFVLPDAATLPPLAILLQRHPNKRSI